MLLLLSFIVLFGNLCQGMKNLISPVKLVHILFESLLIRLDLGEDRRLNN